MKIDAKTIHDRYKSLSNVEHAFKTCKTSMLELRPWFVHSEQSTRGHAFIVMLAYKIVRYLENVWRDINFSVPESIKLLSTEGQVILWASEAGDRSLWWGNLRRGGMRKVAERLVKNLKKYMDNEYAR